MRINFGRNAAPRIARHFTSPTPQQGRAGTLNSPLHTALPCSPPSTHHLPHPILALHLGPQLHKALLHALMEGPQILRHLLSVDPDSL